MLRATSLLKRTQSVKVASRAFGAVHKADGDHKFIAADVKKETLVFDGLKPAENTTYTLDNLYRHHNDLPLTQ
jgi:hypothetical protein